MYIPVNWEYKNPSFYHDGENDLPQSFGNYRNMLGAFQISCIPINDHARDLIKKRNEPIQSSSNKTLFFSETFTKHLSDEVYLFSCAVDDHYILATYIITNKSKSRAKEYDVELSDMRKTLSTIKFIKPEFREDVISIRRYDLFMASIGATIDLMNKALENEALIEYVALSANRIDALLRLSIILSSQIVNKTDKIDTMYLFQNEKDKPLMERAIYKTALEKEIITQIIFDNLETLYKQRNKVIHRFIITDIRTEDIVQIVMDYSIVGEKVDSIVNELELKQSELKIGIHKNNAHIGKELDKKQFAELVAKIRDKHGNLGTETILGEKLE